MSNVDQPLVVHRRIRATPERLFAAWTRPDQLTRWWGPAGVDCIAAHVDLRVGGEYRIANRFPDGRVVWITGHFETVEPPHRLVYSWSIDAGSPQPSQPERVTVRFDEIDRGTTDVVIVHERIATDELRRGHEIGWHGCLDGLEAFLRDGAPAPLQPRS